MVGDTEEPFGNGDYNRAPVTTSALTPSAEFTLFCEHCWSQKAEARIEVPTMFSTFLCGSCIQLIQLIQLFYPMPIPLVTGMGEYGLAGVPPNPAIAMDQS